MKGGRYGYLREASSGHRRSRTSGVLLLQLGLATLSRLPVVVWSIGARGHPAPVLVPASTARPFRHEFIEVLPGGSLSRHLTVPEISSDGVSSRARLPGHIFTSPAASQVASGAKAASVEQQTRVNISAEHAPPNVSISMEHLLSSGSKTALHASAAGLSLEIPAGAAGAEYGAEGRDMGWSKGIEGKQDGMRPEAHSGDESFHDRSKTKDDSVVPLVRRERTGLGALGRMHAMRKPASSGVSLDGSALAAGDASHVWRHLPEESPEEIMFHLGDGVGSMEFDRMADRSMDHEFRRRLEVQDAATLLLLTAAFALTITVSCLSIYHVADDHSPVLFYTDPKFSGQTVQHRLVCSSTDTQTFLDVFNTQPQIARLRIVGKRKCESNADGLFGVLRLREISRQLRLWSCSVLMPERSPSPDARLPSWDGPSFDVSLDLAPFITSDGRLFSDTDRAALEKHLHAQNPLEVMLLSKHVEWPCWEDMATNVRQRLRALGFPGDVEVRLEATEEVLIFRNHPWQNFVRSRITQALVLLSLVGAVLWFPYLWMRMRTVRVESRFRISLDLTQYWEHLSDGLHPTEGFRAQSQSQRG